ncbi:MAG: AAA family ATPase [Elusimicrobiota bacterium]
MANFVIKGHEGHSNLINFTKLENVSQRVKDLIDSGGFDLEISGYFSIKKYSNFDIMEKLKPLGNVICIPGDRMIVLNEEYIVSISARYKRILYNIYSSSVDLLKLAISGLKNLFSVEDEDEVKINLCWYFIDRGSVRYENFSMKIAETMYDEAYPYLDIKKLAEDFKESSEQVLVLIGPAGTGKTRLIRYIVRELIKEYKVTKEVCYDEDEECTDIYSDPSVSFTSDIKVLEESKIFMDLLNSSNVALILEDIDFHLRSRKDGNTTMYKLLSASDGFISNINSKIIVSTNLESGTKIDEAFVRPGRCYGIVETRNLDMEESYNLLKVLGCDNVKLENKSYSLGEIYRHYNEKKSKRKFYRICNENKCSKVGF